MKFNGNRLRKIRKSYGLSRNDLVEMIPNINSRHTVKGWEEQSTFPNRKAITILIKTFPEVNCIEDLMIDLESLDEDIARAKEVFASKTRGGLQ